MSRTSPGEPDVPSRVRSATDARESRAQWVALAPGSAKRTAVMVILLVVALWIGVWAFDALGSFLFLLLLSWLFSIAMEPPVLWMVAHGVRRGFATGIVMVAMLVLVLGGVGVEAGAAEARPERGAVEADDGPQPAPGVVAEHDLLVAEGRRVGAGVGHADSDRSARGRGQA